MAVILVAGCAATAPGTGEPPGALVFREARQALRTEPPAPETEPQPPLPPPPPPPHSSVSAFFGSHFSNAAWSGPVWDDYLTEPPVLFPVVLGAAAVAVSFFDEKFQEEIGDTFGNASEIGDVALGVLVAGSVLDGLLAPGAGRTASEELWTQGEAFAVNFGVTEGLKAAVGRLRPNGVGGRSSFPSGHASTAFTAATLIERNAGLGLGVPAYALATLTAYSRVEAGKHFPSDVLAGAAIGILTASVLDALHFGRESTAGHRGISRRSVELEASAPEGGGFLVGFTVRF